MQLPKQKYTLCDKNVHKDNNPAILVTVCQHLEPCECSVNIRLASQRNKNETGLRNLSDIKMSEENWVTFRAQEK